MRVLYAGSFNPWHHGHQFVYDMACKMFGKENVIIGIAINPNKPLKVDFSTYTTHLLWSMAPLNAQVVPYEILTADFCKQNNIEIIVRGVRPGKSLEYEEDLMYWNNRLSDGSVNTIFIPTPPHLNQLSSTIIRDLSAFGKDVSEYCNPIIYHRWKTGKIPTKRLFFGRSCCGKSELIKKCGGAHILNCDTAIWKYLAQSSKPEFVGIKDSFKKAFDQEDWETFENNMRVLWKHMKLNWGEFLSGTWDGRGTKEILVQQGFFSNRQVEDNRYSDVDFANFGAFYDGMDLDILTNYVIVEVVADDDTRRKIAAAKGWDVAKLEKLDKLYKAPPFRDAVEKVEWKAE